MGCERLGGNSPPLTDRALPVILHGMARPIRVEFSGVVWGQAWSSPQCRKPTAHREARRRKLKNARPESARSPFSPPREPKRPLAAAGVARNTGGGKRAVPKAWKHSIES